MNRRLYVAAKFGLVLTRQTALEAARSRQPRQQRRHRQLHLTRLDRHTFTEPRSWRALGSPSAATGKLASATGCGKAESAGAFAVAGDRPHPRGLAGANWRHNLTGAAIRIGGGRTRAVACRG